MINRILRNKLLKKSVKDTIIYFIGTSASKLASFFIIPFINTFFTVEEFGRYDLFLITSTFILWIIGLGLDSGFSIKIVDHKEDKNLMSSLFTKSILLSIGVWGAVFFAVFFINFLFNLKYFNLNEIICLFLYILFSHISSFIFSFFRWFGNSKKAAIISAVSSILGILLGGFFVYYFDSSNIITFIYGMLVGAFLGVVFSIFLAKDYIILDKTIFRNNSEFKDLLKLSLPFVPNYLAKYFASYSDRYLIVVLFSDLKLVGLYALFYRIAQIFNLFLNTITSGFLPVMLSNYKTDQGRRFSKKIYNYVLLALLLVFVVSFGLKDFLIRIIGSKNYDLYSPYGYLLPITIISLLIYSIMNINGFGYIIKKKTIYIVYINVLGVLLNFIFAFSMYKVIGFSAVVLSTLISSITISFLYTYYSERLFYFAYNLKLTFICYLLFLLLSFGIVFMH